MNSSSFEFIAPMFLGLGLFTLIGYIVQTVIEGRRRQERIRVFTEFHNKLLDRIGSPRKFGEFLQSPGGMRFLESLSVEAGRASDRLIRTVQNGVILTVVGLALRWADGSVPSDVADFFDVTGVVVLALGVGFLLSAVATYIISKSLGVLVQPAQKAMPAPPASTPTS